MIQATISEIKNRLSYYLRLVSLTGIMEPPMIGVMEPAVRGQKTGLSKWPI
ncbi:MAG: hypothetical protein H8E10_15825 [Desulfobacterales bacterium]|nr:hypothetical protein [Desulfobacterales bacterium]